MKTQNRNIALFALSLGAVDLVALNVLVAPLVFTVPAAVAIEERVVEVSAKPAVVAEVVVPVKEEIAPVPVPVAVPEPRSWSLLFGTGSWTLNTETAVELEKIAVAAKASTEPLKITGSADPRGVEARNFLLSERRAKAVARWLAKRGVSEERMSIEGIGEISPDSPGEQGYQRARRVEVTLGRSP